MSSATWDAKLYDDKHSFVWEKARGVVELLAPKSGERILDLGCGTGHLTAEIAAVGAIVTGIDRSPEMIAKASAQHPGLEFKVADAREVSFDCEFDAVFSNAALHWIPEPEKVIRAVTRALKPGGRFVAEFGGKGNIHRLMKSIESAFAQFGTIPYAQVNPWYYPSVAEYSGLLEKHGLLVRDAALIDRPTRLEDGEKGLDNWLYMFAESLLKHVREAQRDSFLREVERKARPELLKDGVWELDYRRLRIAAFKEGVDS